jgi:hypothetical protein
VSAATHLAIALSVMSWPVTPAGMTLLWGLALMLARREGQFPPQQD